MLVAPSCILCYQGTASPRQQLCLNCRMLFTGDEWFHCSRCGQKACCSCRKMSSFQSVSSLYTYSPHVSWLLKAVKDRQCPKAICAFQLLYQRRLREYMSIAMQKYNITQVVIVPMRRERFFKQQWHPCFFLYDLCGEMGYSPFLKSVAAKRQARLSPLQRLLALRKKKRAAPVIRQGNPQHNTIFLDDVITSGHTLLQARQLYHCAEAHALSLFRAPQKQGYSSSSP